MRPVRAALALVLGLVGVAAGIPTASVAAEDAPVRLALAMPLVVPQSTTPFISGDALAQYTSPTGLLTRQLDAVIGRPVAIGIDPLILASIRVLGSAAPVTATAWLDRLATATNETFPLAYSDSDLTLATQAGNLTALVPLSLDFAIDPALFAPAPDATATPTPTPTPTPTLDAGALPALPTSETLVAWPYTLANIAWPRADSVVTPDLSALTATGYTTAILASGNVTREAGASASVTIDDVPVLVADDGVTSALSAATHALGVEEWQSAMDALTASISAAGAAQFGSQPTVFATLDRTAPLTSSRITDTLGSLQATVGITSVTMAEALATPTSAATIVDEPQDPDAVAHLARLLLAEQGEQRFAIVASDPGAITGERRLALLRLTSIAWQGNSAGWATATDDFVAASVDLRDSVQLVKSSGLNFAADRSSIPIYVKNSLDQAVTVYINVHPETALLAIEDPSVKLVIEPNSQGRGEVPAQALSNGAVQLTVTLTGPSGEVIGTPTRTKVNVAAGWETPVVLAFAVFVFGVFGFGIVRSILKRRRSASADVSVTDD